MHLVPAPAEGRKPQESDDQRTQGSQNSWSLNGVSFQPPVTVAMSAHPWLQLQINDETKTVGNSCITIPFHTVVRILHLVVSFIILSLVWKFLRFNRIMVFPSRKWTMVERKDKWAVRPKDIENFPNASHNHADAFKSMSGGVALTLYFQTFPLLSLSPLS